LEFGIKPNFAKGLMLGRIEDWGFGKTSLKSKKEFIFGLVNQELVLLATSIKRNNIIWKRRGFNGICVKCG